MKKTVSMIFILCMLLALCTPALAVVEQSESFYAADYADVLTAETEQLICDYNGALETQCSGAQLVVVTVDYLDGLYSDEYAMRLFNNWGVGDEDEDNGMLLLLGVKENKAWLTTGGGIYSAFPDSQVDKYFEEYFWDKFDSGDYDGAVNDMFFALLAWYDNYYGAQVLSSSGGNYGDSHSGIYGEVPMEPHYGGGFGFMSMVSDLFSILLIIVLLIVFISIFTGTRRVRRGGSFMPFIFMGTHRRRPPTPRPPRHAPPPRHNSFNGGFGGSSRPGGFGGGGRSGRPRGSSFGGSRPSGRSGGFGGGMGRGGGGSARGGGGRR